MVTDTIIDDKIGLGATEAQVLAFDRRRAGRQQVSEVLVPLLRDPASGTISPDLPSGLDETPYRDYIENDPFDNELAPSRGILLGLSLSMLFWGAIGYSIFR